MNRTALQPFKFSNGVVIPPGSMLCTHQWAVHRDGGNYSNPDVFDGERFLEKDWIRAEDVGAGTSVDGEKADAKGEKAGARKTMYSTSRTYLAFGHGKHAWYVKPFFPGFHCHKTGRSLSYIKFLFPFLARGDSSPPWNWKELWHTSSQTMTLDGPKTSSWMRMVNLGRRICGLGWPVFRMAPPRWCSRNGPRFRRPGVINERNGKAHGKSIVRPESFAHVDPKVYISRQLLYFPYAIHAHSYFLGLFLLVISDP